MWICMNDAFLSIVDDKKVKGCLVVRARRHGDIEKVFPDAKPKTLRGRDYMYRAHIKREIVAGALFESIMGINYPNFKDSVVDDRLHSAYARFWNEHAKLQLVPPYRM